ncbi:MAG: hypothetical protein IT204_01745 [Fimbriimonadaceae bacterium]|nr:hypothetical protein [Fimbriimonadaceae bacterium]
MTTCLLLAAGLLAGDQYLFTEVESAARRGGSVGLRQEGFTPWMRHPSGGAVLVLGGDGWVEWTLTDLPAGDLQLYVRGLSWRQDAVTLVSWDGAPLGAVQYDQHSTSLAWSRRVATVRGGGEHRLRLAAAPGNQQVPYLDCLLLTTALDVRPDDEDQDFRSFQSVLPPLELPTGRVLPLPDGQGEPAELTSVAGGALVVGPNPLTLQGPAATAAWEARIGDGAWSSGQPPAPVALHGGRHRLELRQRVGERLVTSGAWMVEVPALLSAGLATHAVPRGTAAVEWTATLHAAVDQQRELAIRLRLLSGERVLHEAFRAGAAPEQGPAVPLGDLAAGRYEVEVAAWRDGQPAETLRWPLYVYEPAPAEPWEPVRRVTWNERHLLLNGRPFLGRLLYHTADAALAKRLGCNLLQCAGWDPDPREKIAEALERCREAEVYGFVALFNNRWLLDQGRFNLPHLRQVIEQFREHPALLGWDLVDEPDGQELDPAAVAEAATLIRQLDPHHPLWINLCRPDQATRYLAAQDLWSYDAYPLGSPAGLRGYLEWLSLSDRQVRGQRPLGVVLQGYNSAGLRLPTPEELRASAWLHAQHGYNWFSYYSWFDPAPALCLARDPVLGSYLAALNAELLTWRERILSGRLEGLHVNLDSAAVTLPAGP